MIDDVPVNFLVYGVEFHAFRLVDCIEQGWKRVAQVEAAPATMADIEDTLEFPLKRVVVIEFVSPPGKRVPRRRLETAFSSIAFVTHDPLLLRLRGPVFRIRT